MMSLMLLLFLTAAPLSAQTLSVVHKKDFWRDGRGTIEITKEAVIYQARKKTDSRKWTYSDIRHFDRISEQEFVLLTYEDQNLFLGRDRRYHFAISEGRLNDSLFHKISLWLGKPVTNRVLRRIEGVQYEIPVKHLHPWDGCEGKLRFTIDRVYYLADEKKHRREWLLARDVHSVWSMDRFHLEIHAYEGRGDEFSRTRAHQFQLKQPLDRIFYRDLKLKLHHLEGSHQTNDPTSAAQRCLWRIPDCGGRASWAKTLAGISHQGYDTSALNPRRGRKDKKISTKGHEGPRRDTKKNQKKKDSENRCVRHMVRNAGSIHASPWNFHSEAKS